MLAELGLCDAGWQPLDEDPGRGHYFGASEELDGGLWVHWRLSAANAGCILVDARWKKKVTDVCLSDVVGFGKPIRVDQLSHVFMLTLDLDVVFQPSPPSSPVSK